MKRTPLTRSTPLRSTTPMRKRSRKQAKVYREQRIPLVRRLLAERPACEARFSPACTGQSVDCHEPLSRARGGSITDEANVMCVCRACHDEIHRQPAEATRRGFTQRRRAG